MSRRVDITVIITSLISGLFGLMSTTLAVILPRFLDTRNPMTSSVPVKPLYDLPDVPIIRPRGMISQPVIERSLFSPNEILFIVGVTIVLVLVSVGVVLIIRKKRHS